MPPGQECNADGCKNSVPQRTCASGQVCHDCAKQSADMFSLQKPPPSFPNQSLAKPLKRQGTMDWAGPIRVKQIGSFRAKAARNRGPGCGTSFWPRGPFSGPQDHKLTQILGP